MQWRRGVLVAVALVLTLAACGSSGGDASSDTTGVTADTADSTTTTEATTSTTETSETTDTTEGGTDTTLANLDPAAQTRAEAIDLGAADVPTGWKAVPHTTGEAKLLKACSDLDLGELSIGSYFDDDLQFGAPDDGAGKTIEVGTRVFTDEATATSVTDLFGDAKFISCANDFVQQQFPNSTVTGTLAKASLEAEVDQTSAFVGQLSVSDPSGGDPVKLGVAFLALRTGDLVTGVSATAVGQDPDTAALQQVIDRVIALQAA